MRHSTLLLLVASSLPAFAGPQTTTLNLVSESGFNIVQIGLNVPDIGSSSDTTTLTGDVQLQLDINPLADQVRRLTVTGGSVTGTPITLAKSRKVLGLTVASYNLSTTTLGATLSTPNPPGVVDHLTGEFDASQHSFTINSGTLSGTFYVLGDGTSPLDPIDFATSPVTGAGEGTGTISLTQTGSTASSKTYDVEVLLPVEIEGEFQATETVVVTLTSSGTVKAAGTVTVPITPFHEWIQANGMPSAVFDDDDIGGGMANGLRWAMGLPVNDPPYSYFPKPVGMTATMVNYELALPPGGATDSLRVLVGSTLDPMPSTLLASANVSSGNPIPVGTSGTVLISLPKTTKQYLAVEATEP